VFQANDFPIRRKADNKQAVPLSVFSIAHRGRKCITEKRLQEKYTFRNGTFA
jgi:hypothetical protein